LQRIAGKSSKNIKPKKKTYRPTCSSPPLFKNHSNNLIKKIKQKIPIQPKLPQGDRNSQNPIKDPKHAAKNTQPL
jgi:hypothetical protein